jgi:hypothetical protein
MAKMIAAYHLGNIQVKITETSEEDKLQVDCNDGAYHSAFTVRQFEYENYKRHMNQRIKNAFDKQYEEKY